MKRRGRLIVVVDDDPDIARFIEIIMHRCGFEIAVAGDGQDGFDRTLELRPDLVITNVNMPRMEGFTFTERIREHPDIGATPVLILTGRDRARDKLRGLVTGADDYMVKPFDPHDLVARVRSLFERSVRPDYARPLEGDTSATEQDALDHLDAIAPRSVPGLRSMPGMT